MSTLITPRTLSGFRDYLPHVMLAREKVLQIARDVYRSYGFTPIDTPACEALDVLLGKGGEESDKLVYRVRSAKSEKEEMGLRFDLTVPFALLRQVHQRARHPIQALRHGAGARRAPGQGRYREFWQCDFDTIGTTSNAADIETVLVINDLFSKLGFEKFEIRINNRLLLNSLLDAFDILDKAVPVLRSLDKLLKIGRDKVTEEMVTGASLTTAQAETVLNLVETTGSNAEILAKVEEKLHVSQAEDKTLGIFSRDKASQGFDRLSELLTLTKVAGIPDGRIKIDLSITRGLDYYTGTIYETFLTDLTGIGSVCSGGRYDNLASKFATQRLPGVGASLGLDRLVAAMEELKHPFLTGQATRGRFWSCSSMRPASVTINESPAISARPASTSRSTRTRKRSASNSPTPRSAASSSPSSLARRSSPKVCGR